MRTTNGLKTFLASLAMAAVSARGYTPPSSVLSALDKLRGYGDLTKAAGSMDIDLYASNMTTWQMGHGGFYKAMAESYVKPWDGKAALSSSTSASGAYMGTFDNNATIQEMRFLAVRYKATANASYKTRFKDSFQKAVGFILSSQLPNGGWPQMYPKRGNYSDMATYNDNAMVRVMVLVKDIIDRKAPFDSDIASSANLSELKTALDKSVQFAIKAQIVNSGKPTVWCAQHDPSTYKPVAARAYELASKSGSESVGIAYFLMAWPDQTPAVQSAVKGAIAWFKKTRVPDLKFSSGSFVSSPGASLWYRFYEVDSTDEHFFCDREGPSSKTQDFSKISEERRTGYQWGGDYGSTLLGMESAYLSALGASSLLGAGGAGGFSVRRSLSGLAISVPSEGAHQVRLHDPQGRLLLRHEAVPVTGRIHVPIPVWVANRCVVVRVAASGGRIVGESIVALPSR